MENKYYQPELSELYVGYETYWIKDQIKELTEENLVPVTFTSKKLSSTLFPPIQWEHEDTDNFKPNLMSYRTKYLTSDDIISLGFNKIADNRYELICDNKGKVEYGTKFYIELYYPYETPWITITHEPVIWCSETISYIGRCKSKNELKTILSWIK